jgi:ABC-2 type transport system permease protein/oleandomycin transport system permease protein
VAARLAAGVSRGHRRCAGGQWAQPAPLCSPTGLLVFSTIQPIMFVLLFTYVFGGAISHSLPVGVS